MLSETKFQDRTDAGQQLADVLMPHLFGEVLVLALPRGGVPVAFEIAHRCNAPLDTVIVRKVGAPGNPEFAVGAIAAGGIDIIDMETVRSLGITREAIEAVVERERAELTRRAEHYQSGTYHTPGAYDTVILVDDGVATGMTARAAIESVRRTERPRHFVFATPVASRDAALELSARVDRVVCVHEVDDMIAIGVWYDHFEQMTDAAVIALLETARVHTVHA